MDYISYKYDSEKKVIILLVDDGEKTQDLEIGIEAFQEIASVLPVVAEMKLAKDVMELGYKIRKEQCLTIEDIAKEGNELKKKHEDVRDKLLKASDKIEVMALSAVSKDLGTEKVILDTKRHLMKQLDMRIAEARNKALALEAGFKREDGEEEEE